MMYKFIIKITILITSIMMPAYTDSSSIDEKFISDNKKICAAKDNSSAELLIRTVIACQNVGENSKLLPMFYLATDQHDQTMNIKMQENGTFTVGAENEPFNFPLAEFRHNLAEIFRIEEQKYVLYSLQEQRKAMYGEQVLELNNIDKPCQIELKTVGDFVIESDDAMPELGQKIAIGSISYSGVDVSKEPSEKLSKEVNMIRINDKYYMFNLSI